MSGQAQNDSGGGCLLFLIDWIGNIIQNRRIRKRNKQSRGLEEYQSITTDVLLPPESCEENIIISGGNSLTRLKFTEQMLKNAYSQNRSMIMLHLGNDSIERMITHNNFGRVAGNKSRIFDAFTSFEFQEICQVVFDTQKSKYEIKPAARYILQIVYDLLAAQQLRPYFANFANFTYHKIPEKINDALSQRIITQDQANELNSLLMMGQAEIAKIDSFFFDMRAQMNHLAAGNPSAVKASSVLFAIKKNQILSVDLNSSANVMFVELIVNSLTIAMSRGYEFSLFIDDVAVANNELLKNALCQRSAHNNILCTKDLYALLNGKEDIFTTIVGVAEKTILLNHGSHLSCEKWSKYIGEYDKIDVSHNNSGGFFQSGRWGYVTNQGKTMTDKRELKIKPEQLNRLQPGEIVAYDNQTGSLLQALVV